MELKDILAKCDHTLLTQTATWAEIKGVCDDGMKYHTASVCIPASYVKQAKEYVGDKLPICTVIGFPNGYMTTAAKAYEAADAVRNGAEEIDMVINVSMVKDGCWEDVARDISAVREATRGHILKVIIECCLLTEEEKQAVEAFSHKIDIRDTNQVLQYGAAAQKSVASFSENALNNVRSKDMGEIGEDLSRLVVELKGFGEEDEKKGLFGLFKKASNKLETMKAQYSKVEANVDKIAQNLENHQITLLKDVAVMDQMYERNLQYFKELTMYILAGKQKLAEARNTTLRQLREKAEASNLPEDAQAANDFENKCVRFEKKLHDLELTRMISLQTAPQIRMIQNNDTALVEKIQTSVLNTIPLWKNQMVLTLGIENSRRAMEAQRQVTDMTNALLQKNADMLHMASVETAKESERGIVDMETLKHTNEQLISTLDEVLQIQTDGAKKRQEAEAELRRLEGELKQKLLQPRS